MEPAETKCIHFEPKNLIWIMPAKEEYIFDDELEFKHLGITDTEVLFFEERNFMG